MPDVFPPPPQVAKAKLRAAFKKDWAGTDEELDAWVERLYSAARALGTAMERGARPAHPATMIGRG